MAFCRYIILKLFTQILLSLYRNSVDLPSLCGVNLLAEGGKPGTKLKNARARLIRR